MLRAAALAPPKPSANSRIPRRLSLQTLHFLGMTRQQRLFLFRPFRSVPGPRLVQSAYRILALSGHLGNFHCVTRAGILHLLSHTPLSRVALRPHLVQLVLRIIHEALERHSISLILVALFCQPITVCARGIRLTPIQPYLNILPQTVSKGNRDSVYNKELPRPSDPLPLRRAAWAIISASHA